MPHMVTRGTIIGFVSFFKVSFGFFWFWNHCIYTWLPIGWTDLTILIIKLERLNQSFDFIHRSADWQIIDSYLSNDTFGIDNKKTTIGNTFIFFQNTVCF